MRSTTNPSKCIWIVSAGKFAEESLRPPLRPGGGNRAEAAIHDTLVGHHCATVVPVADNEGPGPGRMDANAAIREHCVPFEPGRLCRLEGIDGPTGEVRVHRGGGLSCVAALGDRRFAIMTRTELGDHAWSRPAPLRSAKRCQFGATWPL